MNGKWFSVFCLGALVSFLAFSPAAHAQEAAPDPCPLHPDVAVNVTPVFEEPSYNDDATLPQLQQLSRDAYHVIPEGLTLGLTHYSPVLVVRPYTTTRDLSDGTTCVQVDHVDISFGYRNVVVYVAHEIPPGSCGFNEVMAHEQKHVAVQKQILIDFIPTLQQRLKDYLAQYGAIRDKDYGQAVNWMHDNVENIAHEVIGQVMSENTRLQRNIDTVEEYARVSDSCNGQLRDIVAHSAPNSP